MRVLIITLTDDPLDPPGVGRYGGAQAFMFDLGRHLVRKGHRVSYLTRLSRSDKPSLQRLGPSCTVHRLKVGPPGETNHHQLAPFVDELFELLKELLLKQGSFDSVLSYNWISGLLAKETGIRPHAHHILSLGRVRQELLEEQDASDQLRDQGEIEVFRSANHLICTCSDELSSLLRLYPTVNREKCHVIPYGIDSDVFSRRPLSAQDHLRRASKRFEEGL